MMPRKDRAVCQLTSVHPPHDTRIFHKECRSLAEAGYEVTLIAPGPHKANGDGIRSMGPPRTERRLSRMVQSLFRYPFIAAGTDASVVHFHDPELLPGAIVLRLMGRKVVYDVHEDVPADIMDKPWIARCLRLPVSVLMDVLERFAAVFMTAIVAATPKIAERFPARKTYLVQNFPLLSELPNSGTYEGQYAKRENLFGYIGSITELRGAKEMLEAIALCNENISGVRLKLGGNIWPERLEMEMHSHAGWKYVDWLGWCDRPKMISELGGMRAGLVLFHPAKNHIEAQPNKLFEYMSAGIPLIASDFPLWRNIIETVGCGLLVDPRKPTEIASAMMWLLDHPDEAEKMGKRGQAAVASTYNWESQRRVLIAFYSHLFPA